LCIGQWIGMAGFDRCVLFIDWDGLVLCKRTVRAV
jgi:hypothetical protein